MASRTTTGITRRVVMRTMGTPKPGSLVSFCFSCIFCNSVEVGLFSILVSTTASDSSGKEEFTIFNWLKDSKTLVPTPTQANQQLLIKNLLRSMHVGVHISVSESTKLPGHNYLLWLVLSPQWFCTSKLVFFESALCFLLSENSIKEVSSFCIFFSRLKLTGSNGAGRRTGVRTGIT